MEVRHGAFPPCITGALLRGSLESGKNRVKVRSVIQEHEAGNTDEQQSRSRCSRSRCKEE